MGSSVASADPLTLCVLRLGAADGPTANTEDAARGSESTTAPVKPGRSLLLCEFQGRRDQRLHAIGTVWPGRFC